MNKEKDSKGNILLRFFAILGILALLLALTAVACEKKGELDDLLPDPPFTTPDDNDNDNDNDDDNNDVNNDDKNNIVKGKGGDGNQDGGVDQNNNNVNANCAEEGFTVTFENEDHKNAFTFGKFAKDATSGSFDADLTVKLSQLTHANGFVSNHVWIHPDENKFAMPFEERGILGKAIRGTTNNGGARWTLGRSALTGYDFKFCGFDPTAPFQYQAARDSRLGQDNDVWEWFDPAKLDGTVDFAETYNTDVQKKLFDVTTDGDMGPCGDIFRYGDVVQAVAGQATKGRLKVGYTLPATLFAGNIEDNDDAAIKWDEDYETSMDKTGAYYVRDSMAYKYVKEGTEEDAPESGAVAIPFVTNVNHVYRNDTNLLYDEFVTAFKGAGVAMAELASVFDADINMGASTTFLRQPAAREADNSSGPFTTPWKSTAGVAGITGEQGAITEGGTDKNGGWQKLFTITPCDTKMTNGIAIVYNHGTEAAATTWKGAPTLSFDGATAFDSALEKTVIVRKGAKDKNGLDAGNSHALLIESAVSPKYKGDTDLGFFTIQHATPVNLAVGRNVLTTKGVIHCRSALAFADDATKATNTGKVIAADITGGTKTQANIAAYENKLQGYKDGAISDDTKGPGLTCYLGLSALWPDAVDGAPKLTADGGAYDIQFEDNKLTKKVDNQFDYSDKHLGLLMINMPEDVAVNNALLLPIFNQFSTAPDATDTGAAKKIDASKAKAKSILEDIKDESTFGYLHGNVKVTFSKD